MNWIIIYKIKRLLSFSEKRINNPDLKKQSQFFISFFQKAKNASFFPLTCNNSETRTCTYKHLVFMLDEWCNITEDIHSKISIPSDAF